MFRRRSLRLPITLGPIMIVLLVALTVGWVLLAVVGALRDPPFAGVYWTVLALGTTFLVLVLVGVIVYLTLSVKAINLNRRQSNFIDSVTHELKSPLASLKLYLQTLNRRAVGPEETNDFYRFMLEDVERLDRLVNHVLDAARLDKARVDTEQEDVELSSLLRETAEAVCLAYRVPNDTVRLDTQRCVVHAAKTDLEIIFRNLIDNAVKYAGSQPLVEIALRVHSDGAAVTTVSDNGAGIPMKSRRKIFGRFYRLGLELHRDKPGTGLGLFIVRTLVRRLGGRISVAGREGTSGTVFEVRLPARAATPEDVGPPETRAAEKAEVA